MVVNSASSDPCSLSQLPSPTHLIQATLVFDVSQIPQLYSCLGAFALAVPSAYIPWIFACITHSFTSWGCLIKTHFILRAFPL